MKKLLATVISAVMLFSMIPVLAGSVTIDTGTVGATTGATVPVGVGNPPIVKAKWEAVDYNPSVIDTADDDPTLPGTQINPPMAWEDTVTVEYCAVITDPDGKGNIVNAAVDVSHPDGSFKYQIPLAEVPTSTPAEQLAAANLVQYASDNGTLVINPIYSLTEVKDELLEKSAKLFCGKADLDYHQMCGEFVWRQECTGCPSTCVCTWVHDGGPTYVADVYGIDAGNLRGHLINNFEYICTSGIELDFDSIVWGSVIPWQNDRILNTKWVEGDWNWDAPPMGPACKAGDALYCRPPTIRNIGNIPVYIGVAFDDMKLGKSGSDWNVDYDSSIKHNLDVVMLPSSAHSKDDCSDFNPASTTTLLAGGVDPEPRCEKEYGVLDLCNKEKMTFSIHIYKAASGDYKGCTLLEPKPMTTWLNKITCTVDADCPETQTCTDGCCVLE